MVLNNMKRGMIVTCVGIIMEERNNRNKKFFPLKFIFAKAYAANEANVSCPTRLKTHLSIVTKANIMKKTDGKFTAICHEIAKDYPGITVEDYYIDIMTANLLKDPLRQSFQVVLLPNLYGDIITDEAAQLQGGVGTAGSANLGDRYAMFEAIHGSAPRMIERGMGDYANPASIIKAGAMLLRHICRAEAAEKLEKAMDECPVTVTSDGKNATAVEYADALIAMLA